MKIILFSNHRATLSVIDYLNALGYLEAVVSTDKLRDKHLEIENFCDIKNIHFLKVNKHDLAIRVGKLFTEIQPDVAIMFGFSYCIPASIYDFPRLGFYNVHFSMLPAYGGPDPIFWQLKNGEISGGVSIHQVDKDFDTGQVMMQIALPFIPGETWGIAEGRHGVLANDMVLRFIEQLNKTDHHPINQSNAFSYYKKITVEDLTIDWERQTAVQIECLINAANPVYGGAITTYRKQPARILEVSPVEGKGQAGVVPGTIIHTDNSGLYVQCMDDNLLRINVLSLNEGVVSGYKMVMLGAERGERFEVGQLVATVLDVN